MAATTPGQRLHEARRVADVSLDYAAAFTQFTLGKSLGISREQLRKMETGMVLPKDWNALAVLALAQCYGIQPEEILPPEVERAGLLFTARHDITEQHIYRSRCMDESPGHGHDLAA